MLEDLRYAARRLIRTPAFSAIAVVTLALGIGITTAFFAIEDALVFRPIREARLDHVFGLWIRDKRIPQAMPLSIDQFRSLEAQPPAGVAQVGLTDNTFTTG